MLADDILYARDRLPGQVPNNRFPIRRAKLRGENRLLNDDHVTPGSELEGKSDENRRAGDE